jgi:hypothetical protein
MHLRALLGFSFIAACAATPAASRSSTMPDGPSSIDSTWAAREPAVCGELRGRVLDQGGRQPVAQAFVTLDSSSRGELTDSLGRFRLSLPPAAGSTVLTRPTYLHIQRVGATEVRVFLPSAFGYVVEVQLAAGGLHVDHLTTVRIKSPGFCARAA